MVGLYTEIDSKLGFGQRESVCESRGFGAVEHPISVYIHLPFCAQKCGYCHFYVVPNHAILKDKLLAALALEWEQVFPLLKDKTLVSIYFGGGTPSLFEPSRIQEVLRWMKTSCKLAPEIEITLEVNPEGASPALLSAYTEAGINRLSMGVQSFDDTLLQRLTRRHSAAKAREAVLMAQAAGISNLSIDLMYEIPGQTATQWEETLKEAVALPITHLSLYNLTIEPATAFYYKRKALQQEIPSQESARAMYEKAQEVLEEAHLNQYEISAFAKTSHFSRHNTGYWEGRPFLGLGPSAFSYWEGKRFRNVASLTRYEEALHAKTSPVDFTEELGVEARRSEQLVLQLRLNKGALLSDFQALHGPLELQRLIDQQWLQIKEDRVCLTKEGQLFYDSLAAELICEPDA